MIGTVRDEQRRAWAWRRVFAGGLLQKQTTQLLWHRAEKTSSKVLLASLVDPARKDSLWLGSEDLAKTSNEPSRLRRYCEASVIGRGTQENSSVRVAEFRLQDQSADGWDIPIVEITELSET